jgi:hypothetical protein
MAADTDTDITGGSGDAASAVKARRANGATKHATATAPEAQTPSAAGIVGGGNHAPATLTGSFVAGHTTSEDYVRTVKAAYHSWYPRGARQPSTVLLWNAGQLVNIAHYKAYGGDDAPATSQDATPVNEPGGGIVVAHL